MRFVNLNIRTDHTKNTHVKYITLTFICIDKYTYNLFKYM